MDKIVRTNLVVISMMINDPENFDIKAAMNPIMSSPYLGWNSKRGRKQKFYCLYPGEPMVVGLPTPVLFPADFDYKKELGDALVKKYL